MKYEKIPKYVRHHMVLAILMKTILDNVDEHTDKSKYYARKYGSGIRGFEVKVGNKSLKKVTELTKKIWSESTGGSLKIEDVVDEFIFLLASTIPPSDHFKLFHAKQYIPDEINEVRCNKYAPIVLSISELLCKELDVSYPSSRLVIKKEKRTRDKKQKKSVIKTIRKRATAVKYKLQKELSFSVNDNTLIVFDSAGTCHDDFIIEKKSDEYFVASCGSNLWELTGDWAYFPNHIFKNIVMLEGKGRYSKYLFASLTIEYLTDNDIDLSSITKVILRKK